MADTSESTIPFDEAAAFADLVAQTKSYIEGITAEHDNSNPLVELVTTLEALAENLVLDLVPGANPHVTSATLTLRY